MVERYVKGRLPIKEAVLFLIYCTVVLSVKGSPHM